MPFENHSPTLQWREAQAVFLPDAGHLFKLDGALTAPILFVAATRTVLNIRARRRDGTFDVRVQTDRGEFELTTDRATILWKE